MIKTGALATSKKNDTTFEHSYDDSFWEDFRRKFHTDDTYLDFRCNAASSIPKSTLKHLLNQIDHIEALPADRNHGVATGEKERLRIQIASEINAKTSEVAIMRNTTEALNNAIMGFPFEKGDEVVASVHEYDSMVGSLYQQEIRKGIKLKKIDVPYKPESAEQIVACYRKAITPKTKMFLISHIIWISGQIYPIKEICELAKRHGIYTVIDAAQSFSHIQIDVKAVGCDFLGSSLHKWAAAPLGTGFLYVKEQNIANTMPLLGNYNYLPNDHAIEKFESFGTITPVFQSASLSLELWQKLGAKIKTERMQQLKQYWVDKLKENHKVEILTNTDHEHSCGIAFFKIKNRSSTEINETLRSKHNIITQAIEHYKNNYVDYKGVNAIGIATSTFTLKKQLDQLCYAVNEITL